MTYQEIDYISINGFKSIRAVEQLKLERINVLIGANGVGKSNFIGIFSFLNAVRDGMLNSYTKKYGGANKILHFGAKFTEELHIKISFKNEVNQYELKLRPTLDDNLYVSKEVVYFWDKSRGFDQPIATVLPSLDNGHEANISSCNLKAIPDWVRFHLSTLRVYHVHDAGMTSPLKRTAKINDNNFLRPDGSNLPAFLYLLKIKFPESYLMIKQTIRMVAPFFDDFILQPDNLNEDSIRLLWSHVNSDQYFDSSDLSDGTLRFIALATLFLQPNKFKPSVIIVDEPELGLHPHAITILASLVRQASTSTQVILSTQSSLLLDHFEPENVLVCDRVDGSTEFRRLSPDDLSAWLEDYSLGQLWEKNELGGRPGNR